MLLRFFGEMNLDLLPAGGRYFVAAWDHIVQLFSKENVANVAFVWAPDLASGQVGSELGSFFSFYPGSSEIDWIGIDALDHQSYGPAGFRTLFEPWYARVERSGPPDDDLHDGGAHWRCQGGH